MTSDPTKAEMLAFLASLPFADEADEIDREGAVYWFGNFYHGGQDSNLYSAMSTSPYHPSPLANGPEPESTEADLYRDLVLEYAADSDESREFRKES